MAEKKEREKVSFEEALKQLETITEQIERGEVGLEESITKYEEGMKLVAKCRNILSKAEQRIQKLTPTPSGGVMVQGAGDSDEPGAAQEPAELP